MAIGPKMRGPVGIAIAIGFLLLIAAIWASGASTATSLAVTGLLVLIGAVAVALGAAGGPPRDDADDQRDRMRRTTP